MVASRKARNENEKVPNVGCLTKVVDLTKHILCRSRSEVKVKQSYDARRARRKRNISYAARGARRRQSISDAARGAKLKAAYPKQHNVFNVMALEPYRTSKIPGRRQEPPPPEEIEGEKF
jgi:hypothetical protein